MNNEQNLNNAETQALNIPVVISSALPCPFCGGKDLQFISDVDGDRDVEFIVCMNNDCLCDGRIGKNKEIACPECGCDDMIDYENHFKRCNKCDYIWRKF